MICTPPARLPPTRSARLALKNRGKNVSLLRTYLQLYVRRWTAKEIRGIHVLMTRGQRYGETQTPRTINSNSNIDNDDVNVPLTLVGEKSTRWIYIRKSDVRFDAANRNR